MNRSVTDHPPETTLAEYARGGLTGFMLGVVQGHIADCPDCYRRLAVLRSGPPLRADTPAAKVTAVQGSPPPDPSAGPDGPPPELLGLPQYADVKVLGRGGMGVVYLARNTGLDRPEVLKVIGRELLGSGKAVERFRREIQTAAKLNHPNVVTAYAILTAGDLLVFAMEYVPGQDLDQLVEQTGPLKVHEAAYYAYQVALGLQHAHERKMVHRDIKPSNLMLHKDGRRRTVKILDFGMAKATQEQETGGSEFGAGGGSLGRLTGEGKMLGTPSYMAPEQASNATAVDIRADIYSLGGTLCTLLTGSPPFAGDHLFEVLLAHQKTPPPMLSDVRPEVPVGLAEVVTKMLAKRPEDRYQTPAEAAEALKPFVRMTSTSSTGVMRLPAAGEQHADFDVVEDKPGVPVVEAQPEPVPPPPVPVVWKTTPKEPKPRSMSVSMFSWGGRGRTRARNRPLLPRLLPRRPSLGGSPRAGRRGRGPCGRSG